MGIKGAERAILTSLHLYHKEEIETGKQWMNHDWQCNSVCSVLKMSPGQTHTHINANSHRFTHLLPGNRNALLIKWWWGSKRNGIGRETKAIVRERVPYHGPIGLLSVTLIFVCRGDMLFPQITTWKSKRPRLPKQPSTPNTTPVTNRPSSFWHRCTHSYISLGFIYSKKQNVCGFIEAQLHLYGLSLYYCHYQK